MNEFEVSLYTSELNDLYFFLKSEFYCLSRGGGGLAGSGSQPLAYLLLSQDPDYLQTYPPGRITLEVGSPLYMEVLVQTKDRDLVVVLEDCYATSTYSPSDPEKQFLIQNK